MQLYGANVASASRPYEFIRFDTFIQKTKKLYVDSRTQRNLDKLNVELRDVQEIMNRNINEVIGRGERMESTYHCFFFLISSLDTEGMCGGQPF